MLLNLVKFWRVIQAWATRRRCLDPMDKITSSKTPEQVWISKIINLRILTLVRFRENPKSTDCGL